MRALECKNIYKSFGGVSAINNVSLNVEMGERRAIIGPNGAGKTTLLNLIGGQLACDKGEMYAFGKRISNLPDYRRVEFGASRTFQLMRLFFSLSVQENIVLAIQGIKPYRFKMFATQESYGDLMEEAEKLMRNWELWERRNALVAELSYGEQRKVELVMGLASNPRLILLDEPTCGLSGDEINAFIDVIFKIGKDITLIVVEHDMDFVFSMATKTTALYCGEIIAEGTPEEMKNNSDVRRIYLGTKRDFENANADRGSHFLW